MKRVSLRWVDWKRLVAQLKWETGRHVKLLEAALENEITIHTYKGGSLLPTTRLSIDVPDAVVDDLPYHGLVCPWRTVKVRPRIHPGWLADEPGWQEVARGAARAEKRNAQRREYFRDHRSEARSRIRQQRAALRGEGGDAGGAGIERDVPSAPCLAG